MLPTKILHIKLHRLSSALRLTISSITDKFEKFKYKSLRGSPGSFPIFLQNRGEIHVQCPIYKIEHLFVHWQLNIETVWRLKSLYILANR